MPIEKVFLWAMGALFALAGIAALVDPMSAVGATGLEIGAKGAATEARVMYGGVQLSIACLFLWSGVAETRMVYGLLFSVVLMGMAAASRVSGMLIEQTGTEYHIAIAVFEAVMFAVSLWLYRGVVRRTGVAK